MNNLKKIREDKNITQAKLSELSGVNLRTLQYYEQGYKDINKAQVITLYRIARVLCCNIEDLLSINNDRDGL